MANYKHRESDWCLLDNDAVWHRPPTSGISRCDSFPHAAFPCSLCTLLARFYIF